MAPYGIIHFDIAATIIMVVILMSLILRRMTKGATNRVYLSAMVLVTMTAIACLLGELYDAQIMPGLVQSGLADPNQPPGARDALTLLYYALRSLTAPVYLVLIATISSTTHRLNTNNVTRVFLWVPMIATLVLVLTNPLHHLVYYYVQGAPQNGPLIGVVYATTAYYSILGIIWLIRWRVVLTNLEFATLLVLYPVVFASLLAQYMMPDLHIDMFIMSIAMLIISAFVIRPEKRLDSLVGAANLPAYREMCRRAFITDRPLCLVFLEIVNLEQLRELVGKDELQNVVHDMAANLSSTLERDDMLYYLRNGLFCISPRNLDVDHALEIAWRTHKEGRAKSVEGDEKPTQARMRTCVVRVPEDASGIDTLKAFIRRFAHLVPQSCVTTFAELSQRDDFELQMALSNIVEQAIENRSFSVHYQPVWCVADGKYHSAEALVRLDDRAFGSIPPTLFIPEAEQSGAIVDIGAIMLEKICQFLETVDFERSGLDFVEVNLSVDQCVRPELADELLDLMRTHNVEPSRMNLEITETSSSYSQEVVADNVRKLSSAGISFSLDDYGTGYSNVTRALDLPFTLIKLDKSFVDNLDSPAVRTVLAETISMMKAVGKQVLAEGAETPEQVETLSKMGIDYIQGYYFAKPMPEEEFIAFLEEHNRD